ncbi:MAG: VOC family protein [SAR202 cluster bacterium]|nr:VOC family protein [SAR202 cluster bacterium]
MPTHTFGLSKIGQIAVSVTDVERSIKFYRDTLGMKFLFQAGTLAFFDCDGVRLMLSIPEKPEFRGASILYFTVPDIQAGYAALQERGVSFIDRPHVVHRTDADELWMAFLKDPDGNHLALMSEVRK